ncbi:MAG: metallophosphoesterase [Phycisphaerae bacterium]|nr:metallophosphoesterase [Phycisphaerae bacterium]
MHILITLVLFGSTMPLIHDGPDPVLSYPLQRDDLSGNSLQGRHGPPIVISTPIHFVPDEHGGGAELHESNMLLVAEDITKLKDELPQRNLTVSAWVSVTTPRRWGGIFSCIQDNDDYEKGWVLGYDNSNFTFGLASMAADDGNGAMTYLAGSTRYELGRLYHVMATYDGTTMKLYVNGRLDAQSATQSGDILYPGSGPVSIGSYMDDNEFHPHEGRLMDVRVYDLTAGPGWIADHFQHHADRVAGPPRIPPERAVSDQLDWQVPPFLQFATTDSIRVVFHATRPVTGRLLYGPTAEFGQTISINEPVMLGELKIEGLKPSSPYFYALQLSDDTGQQLRTEVLSFQTAADRGTPITFAILSDTQDNPEVSGILADHIWEQRPGFLIHPGDLTGTGSSKTDWTEEFFPSMSTLLSRVTIYPVLGNHEQDARHYYRYFSLPSPEYYYGFSQGDVDFFMIDTNRNVFPGSEQYTWLDNALSESDAPWRIVVHHHPPYSSDENDYGDAWKGRSSRGDLRVRSLTTLYDTHGVDLVLNGHIHSYERTWPVRKGLPVQRDGVIYTITGGGGGGLETPAPTRPGFSNTVRRGHHYCMIRVNGDILEFNAYDIQNRLFDHMTIDRSRRRDSSINSAMAE